MRIEQVRKPLFLTCSIQWVSIVGAFVLFCRTVIMTSLANGGDRLRQEPERSSRCMPGYLMQLVKKRRETQLPIMNWLSLPN